ncbi:FtsX-like permease family protein [Lacticaseibacillus paracasei]|uniref:FtsX-like permease family protein n=1 Tax=Lacticaseibacillus paracasei TaxID=1597 RepID=UPI0021C359E6|nr:FtsX-like permease family protein [Lacticaseibacillus paracasei]MCP9308913.1 FtsX-like permease family protein [Lacticaseibacillus paracasei]MCP9345715.1 FtsX-like permease family protein [Lacticaseibacillus paracasei]MCP9365367.1 FtsX-like permease family protein [Lacticaseibacillus paracasei]MCP9377663.1 FtsX-like permease family protein [Lacticaseibacillus paracasei]
MKFYFKLAASNLKADHRLFVPFVTAISFLMAVNLIMLNAYTSSDILFKRLGATAGKSLFMFGTIVIVILSVILAIYANNFLRKQRIRQLGLYNIIGFGKGELGKMMAVEKLLLLLTTLLFGGILGTVFSRISYLVLAKMFKVDHNLDFGLSQQAFSIAGIITIGLFVILLLVDELWLIRKRPIEIVRAQRAGEREPKTKWVTLIFSLIFLVAGYYMAVTITNPMQAMSMFFVAVVLVICGTYGLFTAGSVFVLKWLRNRQKYYYKPKHFINVSNLLYRMQQNGAGLASIAILVTMTLITLASTATLFFGIKEIVNTNTPVDLSYVVKANDTTTAGKVARMASANHVTIKSQHTFVGPSSTLALLKGNRLESQATVSGPLSMGNARSVQLMTIQSYNRFTDRHASIKPNEILIYTSKDLTGNTLRIGQKNYKIGERASTFPNAPATFIPNLFIAFAREDQMIDAMQHLRNARYKNNAEAQADITTSQDLMLQGSHANQLKLYEAVVKSNLTAPDSIQSKAVNYDETMGIMGSFLFIGILFSVTFILATLLIMYYKQLSEGYADARRYTILQRVGLSLREVRSTINSQLLMLFYLPLLVAGIHIGFVLPFAQRIMMLFGLPDWQFFLTVSLITLGIFAIIYVLMYKLTGNVYYRIVSRRRAASRS